MLVPIRTDRPPRRRPLITEALIVANMAVYLLGLVGSTLDWFDLNTFTSWLQFDPQNIRLHQLVTSAFMHDPYSLWHLAFNMLFLWIFGSSVEDRFGHVGFFIFYLGAAAASALAHAAVSSAPVIGASGAIAGVTGAYLALFPRSNILVFFFLTMRVIAISSLWFIGLYIAIDLLRQTGELLGFAQGRVAYMAHLAGYAYGFALAFALLGLKVIPREEFDMFFLFKQARRRAALRAATRHSPAGPWSSSTADTGRRLEQQARAAAPLSPVQQELADARSNVNRLAAANRLDEAATQYRMLLDKAPDTVFSEERQLELANQLCAQDDHAHAAVAYELLLSHYPATAKAAEVRLMLGVIYTRRLQRADRAREILHAVRPTLRDPRQIALVDELLLELNS